ncbi:alpha-amylase family glycosyl hydrolase [Marinilabilia rubra]|uniref:Alpha-amylase n=1 Tax=Marinilabilia rubra TaxID=2162893 RepID=A0A2U2B870_9BACT|nr:alpha-amylase family glycosyl hydrolase [Marinilabilia rubra]PWD99281.1 alpha-amylase [Marinilabilia rubra]
MQKFNPIYWLLSAILLFSACQTSTREGQEGDNQYTSNTPTPKWSKDAVIYEVNIRQYTEEGTINAFAEHLPRLRELGVDILWLMPVYPIGEKNRKGTLGSYYSIKDFKNINPEFGTMEDFKSLVKKIHEMDMHIVLDWVANHTAWDHPWIEEHPEWYTKNEKGEIVAPVEDWSDVADLNYSNQEMRAAMIDALTFWVEETNIDGYRCDMAGMVPVDFWENARADIENIKPVWMLAEDEMETGLLENAFNANYAWELHHIMNDVAKGEKNALDVSGFFEKTDTLLPSGTWPLQFTTNHDENSWNGTAYERMGKAFKTMTALTFTVEGMPLIYSGQEAGLNKSLEFFEKDTIQWKKSEMTDFYKSLINLKKANPALWNGTAGGDLQSIVTNSPESIFCFARQKDDNTVIALFNLSGESVSVFFEGGPEGTFAEAGSGKNVTLPVKGELLQPWEYKIYTTQ